MAGTKNRRSWGWIARQRSKRYLASYIGHDLVRHYAPSTFTAKMDAEAWLANERKLIERGEWTPPAQRQAEQRARIVTLDEYATTWIEQRPLKPRTRQMYKDILRLHISPTLGKVRYWIADRSGCAGLVCQARSQAHPAKFSRLRTVARHLPNGRERRSVAGESGTD